MRFFTLIILLFTLSSVVSAQGFLRTDGTEIVNEAGEPYILKGMGLGGWMLQEGYMLQTAGFANAQFQIRNKVEEVIGAAATEEWYEAWRANHVRESDIESMHQAGFNSVRLPMHYNLYTLPIEEEPIPGEHTWLDTGFELTDSLIAWCKARDMYVVLDLHAAPGGQGNDIGISDRDETKPSLWESDANKDKTVALWRRLAERYADEPTIGGYDLINEVNYSLPGNLALREIYGRITDTIRQVDQEHIIFIEGNWFANDFTGLTPPWDNNMVYSPHKYWSINDQASIQWVLDLRETHNIPLYFGETGENSNVWFRDAAKLFADHGIGWAWWPWKKIDAIAGPVSVPKSEGYQALLDYWNGAGPQPSAGAATAALMGMAEGLKLENAEVHPDVLDALFRQTEEETAIPYRVQDIPGTLLVSDFDMGPVGVAYVDVDQANYQVSTGNYSAWNNGWVYRNDAVDLEISEDTELTNGVHVGWAGTGEWMQYTVNVTEDGLYRARIRTASDAEGGAFHFMAGEAQLTPSRVVPNTGGWQTFQTITVDNIPLTTADEKLRIYFDKDGFNLGGIEFIKTGELSERATRFVAGITTDPSSVRIDLNKALVEDVPLNLDDWRMFVNNVEVMVTEIEQVADNSRSLALQTDATFRSTDDIRVSYEGDAITATDGTSLSTFIRQPINNTIAIISAIPGRMEAEDFYGMSGIQLENTTDTGGGENVGFLDPGDYMDYFVDVASAGTYRVEYRTAAESEIGAVKLQLIDGSGNATDLHSANFAATGGWQTWTTTSYEATLPAGRQQLRILITQPLFNINYLDFTFLTSTRDLGERFQLTVSPNPTTDEVRLSGELPGNRPGTLLITSATGQILRSRRLASSTMVNEVMDLKELPAGTYFLHLRADGGGYYTSRIIKK